MNQADQPLFSKAYRTWLLTLVLLVAAFGYIDRVIIQTLGQAIKEDLELTDFQLGILGGLSFAILYSTLGLPIARLAERRSRINIISASVAIFSGMTVLAGTAAHFWQMFLYRIGVGIGEAGVQAPSVSLLADHFPQHQRGKVMTIMKLGSPVGSVFGAIVGGWVAYNYGWRAAVISVAVPGLLLAVLFKLTLREPPRGYADPDQQDEAKADPPSFGTVMKIMWVRPEFRHMLIGLGLATMGLYAGGAFVSPFFMRVHGLTLAEAGVYVGTLSGAAATAGYALGGFGIDFISRCGARWYALLPAIGMGLSVPFYLVGYTIGQPPLALACQIVGGIFLFFHNIPTLVAFQNMVGPRMRATAAFVFFFVSTLVGVGLGPPLLGLVSDLFANASYPGGGFNNACAGGATATNSACAQASADGVQLALASSMVLYAWGAIHYLIAARCIARGQVNEGNA
jgi:MFS family permease